MTEPRLTRRGLVLSTAAVGTAATLASCARTSPGAGGQPSSTTQAGNGAVQPGATGSAAVPASSITPTPTPVTPVPRPTLVLKNGPTAVRPTDTIGVTVTDGTLTSFTVKAPDGSTVAGDTKDDVFTPKRRLTLKSTYQVDVAMTDKDGKAVTQTVPFTTLTPKADAGYDILYNGYANVGVGMPATIQFVSEVTTPQQRADIERNIELTVTPAQEGSWGWLDNRQLMWRPRAHFKPGTRISLKANLAGLQTGPNKWLVKDAEGGFTIGDARVSNVDIENHTLTVTLNGKVVKTMPCTTGKQPKYTTRSGTKVIIERFSKLRMDSTTVDIPASSPDAYNLDVKWAMRVTWTGEFLHAAPWSVASQGHANVSHGCVGLSDANAEWMFNFSHAGDIVVFTGSNRAFKPTEGIGVWCYPYDEWKARSAVV